MQQVVEVPAALNLVAAGLGVALVPASLALLRGDAVGICSLSPPVLKGVQAGDKEAEGGKADAKGRMKGSSPGPINGDVYVLWRSGDAAPAVAMFRAQLLDWASALPPQRGW